MRRTDSQVAAYPIDAQATRTGIFFPAYAAINDKASAYTTPADGVNPLVLGQHVVDKYGHSYIYVRATEAFVIGQIATLTVNPAEGAIQTADATANNIQILKINITSGVTAGSEVGNFLHIANTTGSIGDLKLIKANTAASGGSVYYTISTRNHFQGRAAFDGDAPAAAYATAGSEVSLIRPWRVEVAGDNEAPYGVAMGTVTSGNNTLVQIEGLAQAKGVAGASFTDMAPVYTAAAGEVDVTDPLTGPGVTARVGFSRSAYGGANSVTVPVALAGISAKW